MKTNESLKNVMRATILLLLAVFGFIGLFGQPADSLDDFTWLAVLFISKLFGMLLLLACGALGIKWFKWETNNY